MSKIKRAIYPELYQIIDGIKDTQDKCDHADFDEYFERCTACGIELYDLSPEQQKAWYDQFEDTPEQLMQRAEQIRDGLREDGYNV